MALGRRRKRKKRAYSCAHRYKMPRAYGVRSKPGEPLSFRVISARLAKAAHLERGRPFNPQASGHDEGLQPRSPWY